MAALDYAGATRRFGPKVALHPTDLAVGAGEVVTLVGPNGAGKSTLLQLGAGLLRPTAGTVRLEGRHAVEPGARAGLGYLPEAPLLPARETIGAFLTFLARLSGVVADVSAVCATLDLPDAGARIGTLSRGTRQRVALAQALVHHPRVILLDEPLTGLDPDARARVIAALGAARDRGAAIVAATHLPEAFAPLAPRVVRVRDGRAA